METTGIRSLLSRFSQIQRQGGLTIETAGGPDSYEVMLFRAATPAEIDAAQRWFQGRLPQDFIEFWSLTNGANLFVNESGLHGVGVASSELIVDLQQEELEFYGPQALACYAIFARVNGAGDFLAFNLETGKVVDGVHAEQPAEWEEIASSFTEWLARILEAEGRYYWLEAMYERANT